MTTLEIPGLSSLYPVIKIEKTPKDNHFLEHRQSKKKPVLEPQEPQARHHIDEVV